MKLASCECGKYKGKRFLGKVCEKCGIAVLPPAGQEAKKPRKARSDKGISRKWTPLLPPKDWEGISLDRFLRYCELKGN